MGLEDDLDKAPVGQALRTEFRILSKKDAAASPQTPVFLWQVGRQRQNSWELESQLTWYMWMNNKECASNEGANKDPHLLWPPHRCFGTSWARVSTRTHARINKTNPEYISIYAPQQQNSHASAPSAGPLEIKYDLKFGIFVSDKLPRQQNKRARALQ